MKKKLLALALAGVLALGVTACGKPLEGENDPTMTTIRFSVQDSGLGLNWARDWETDFNAYAANISCAEDKTGIQFVVTPDPSPSQSLKGGKDEPMTLFQFYPANDGQELKTSQKVYNLSTDGDFNVADQKYDDRNGVKFSIADKIKGTAADYYKANDGDFYELPLVEFYPTLTYNKNAFDAVDVLDRETSFYLANVDENGDWAEGVSSNNEPLTHQSEITGETYYFVSAADAKTDNQPAMGFNGLGDGVNGTDDDNSRKVRSCGPDGVFHTDDDGLPTSIFEMVALCEYMVKNNVIPFILAGVHQDYCSFMAEALMYSLMGYDKALATLTTSYGYNEDGTPNDDYFDVVVGWGSESLFPGLEGSADGAKYKKPITKKVKITEENGYYVTLAVEKYYAEAFQCLAYDRGWFHGDVDKDKNNKKIMETFINSGFNGDDSIGMLSECSFWYQEARTAGFHEAFINNIVGDLVLTKREVRMMSLPRTLDTTITEGNGTPMCTADIYNNKLYVNSTVANNPEMQKAIKVFLQWAYSDERLAEFTVVSSLFAQMDYPLTAEHRARMNEESNGYAVGIQRLVRDTCEGGCDENCTIHGKVVSYSGGTNTFRAGQGSLFIRGYANGMFDIDEAMGNSFFYQYKMIGGKIKSPMQAFENQAWDTTRWARIYQGNKNDIYVSKDENNEDIVLDRDYT